MKTTLNVVLSVLFVAAGVGFVFFFEFYVSEKIDTVEVVVAKETIDFKTVITEENIQIANVKRGHEVENAIPITAYESLIGKHASIKIEKGTQIYTDLIDTYNLVPDTSKGEFVAPIPKEWLFAVPGSLRRTYVADVYAISDSEQKMKAQLEKAAVEQGDLKESDIQEIAPGTEPILESIRVSSVKDSGNKEVRESAETSEATGQVAALEIIATDEMLKTLTDNLNDGYKLYVVYKFERSNEVEEADTDTAEATSTSDTEVVEAEEETAAETEEEVEEEKDEDAKEQPDKDEKSGKDDSDESKDE
ncbi:MULTISPECIES: SAF domain-containing protein [unclassified Planococcus (in: firmicutes)]|uniref:SAF domain-containing protein n=1 Tax=unclassified Planococcus (in: firmicutes) TaxID=2662419 RepID=UPI000C3220AB|nr:MULTISPECIES: SAF domain-containing protein [unclassified Planococcus (in: firmicutes)]AUD12344.1 flagellar biosynthesis protein FlgA [Planococcus sp. MB-3u-03]PKG46573.1 flagellar biosynthesis protein FlgA [Planococcus sp. Urea-trap-24]PKG89741.1 flagellar biosynthesis protein FlgA [Planococcus sp. Urea-3u-39]PKH40856.1 flagellar biosynthesis protein FlgA [Planococcus sp. MB-3u-09]